MPLSVRSSGRRRRKNPDDRSGESTSSEVMAPTRMKLRVRRRDNTAEGGDATEGGGSWQVVEEEPRREGGGRASRRKNNSNALPPAAAAAAASSSSPPSSSSTSASARAVMAADDASPDSKCPICLDRFNNLAYLDRCLHRFCFPCIQEWSHNKAECPLCKQPFASILHSVRGEDDFKEYTLRPPPANSSVAATIAMVAAMASAARTDHQMRLMLRRHRGGDGGETTTRRRRRARGAEENARVLGWYLNASPLSALPLPPSFLSPLAAEDSEEGEELEEQMRRAEADPSERGVIFEGLTGLGGAAAPLAPTDRASRRLMTRLAARQRLQREGGTVRRLRERETISLRRALYRCSIRVRGVAGVGAIGNPEQQQRDITAESFRRNPVHLNRLRPWLRRELTVLYGSHGTLVDIVQRIIMARLARHGLEDTPTIEEELRPFLLARTDHFLHELISFARSPLSLENYDLQAVYEPPDAALELDGMSSSSESSSVIAISEGEEEERREGGASGEPQAGGGALDGIIQSGSCLSLSAWDDETPGPSYSTAEPSCSLSFSPAPQETANEERAGKAEEEEVEECLIVGYKKPIAERTPELVQLSSDTEEEETKKEPEEAPPLPSLAPPLPFLPTIPPSTSGACRVEQDEGLKEKVEAARRCRSWSGSSGGSRKSVCPLSPAVPREGERQKRDRKRGGGEAVREKRKKKRSRRERGRSGDRPRKSGTLFNPNRSIYPAMMRHRSHSPSPFHSSADSASPPSPPDSTWSYHCSQVSPLTSSLSSPTSSFSHSPLFSSPQTPPTPSLSPGYHCGVHHGEKPGGKRKYKSRHLDSDDKDPTWRPSGSGQRREKRRERREKERKQKGRERERRRERGRRDDRRERRGDSISRKYREDRSPSVEIIYEGVINTAQPPARKRRRKQRKTQHHSPPVIITLDSDSSHDDINNHASSASSSPLSSQQTVDFSDLPPLPLINSAGVGGALNADFGELPANILDQGSDGSETEPVGRSQSAGPIAIDNSDSSDADVDVENVEESAGGSDDDAGPKGEAGTSRIKGSSAAGSDSGPKEDQTKSTDLIQKRPPEDLPPDSRLLATILDDLKGLASSDLEQKNSLDTRKGRLGDQPGQDDALAKRIYSFPDFSKERLSSPPQDQNLGSDMPASGTAVPPLPPLEQQREVQVQEGGMDPPPLEQKEVRVQEGVVDHPPLEQKEVRVQEGAVDLPPLLKQASPVRSHNRNTPPSLKHKDARSPKPFAVPPVDLHSASVGPAGVNTHVPFPLPLDPHPDSERPHQTIPPISTLKKHFTSSLALRDSPAMSSNSAVAPLDFHLAAPSKFEPLNSGVHSMSHKPPIDPHSSSESEISSTCANFASRQDFNSAYSKSHSSCNSIKEASFPYRSPPIDFHHANSLSLIDFHSAKAVWSKERLAHCGLTSRGRNNENEGPMSCQVAPVNLHPSRSVASGRTPGGSDDSSGPSLSQTSSPVGVSSASSRTVKPLSPIDSHSFCKREDSTESFSPSMETLAPGSKSSTIDMHSASPKSTIGFNSSFKTKDPSERCLTSGATGSGSSSVDIRPKLTADPHSGKVLSENMTLPLVNREERMPCEQMSTVDLHCSPVPPTTEHAPSSSRDLLDGHLNHAPLSSFNFKMHSRQSSLPEKVTIDSHSNLRLDSKLLNHVNPTLDERVTSDPSSKQNPSFDPHPEPQPSIDSHSESSRRDFQLRADNRTVSHECNAHASIDAPTDSPSPSDGGLWKTHSCLK